MYKIMIVDDNPLIIMGIKNMIKWDEFHATLVGAASNVNSAIEIIDDNEPDLVITDIKMPGKTGLDLLNYLKSRCPSCASIIISAYDEFDYAKQAIKVNCSNYILKPIDPDELNSTIKNILSGKQSQSLCNAESGETYDGKAIIALKTKKCYSELELYNILKELPNVNIIKNDVFEIFTDSADLKKATEILENSLEGEYLLGERTIAKGESAETAYNEALKDASKSLLDKVFIHSDSNLVKGIERDKVLLYCTSGDNNNSVRLFKNYLNTAFFKKPDIDEFADKVNEYLAIFLSIDSEYFKEIKEIMDKVNKLKVIPLYFSIDELVDEVSPVIVKICASYARELGNKQDLVNKVKEMIDKNYQNELSLFEIARLFYVSPSYLSRIFKHETGMNLNNYITTVRIDRAEHLLLETNKKITDIAHIVGYQDPNYFAKVFKKYKGYSPNSKRAI